MINAVMVLPEGFQFISTDGAKGVLATETAINFDAPPDIVAGELVRIGRADLLGGLTHEDVREIPNGVDKDGNPKTKNEKIVVRYTPQGQRVERTVSEETENEKSIAENGITGTDAHEFLEKVNESSETK